MCSCRILGEVEPAYLYDNASDEALSEPNRESPERPFGGLSLPELKAKLMELCLAVPAGLMVELAHDCLFQREMYNWFW